MLRTLRIGVQLIGDDGANSPPAHALSRRGIVRNLIGFSVYGDYRTDSPPSAIVTAVARGDVDVAAVWGPLAGYFAALQPGRSTSSPCQPIHRRDAAADLRHRDGRATRRCATAWPVERSSSSGSGATSIAMLAEYHVPRVELNGDAPCADSNCLRARCSVLCFSCALAGCEREARPFQERVAAASSQKPMGTDLYAGPQRPPTPENSPFQENAWGIAEGKRLFDQFNCVGCHAHGGGGMGPALMDDEWIYGQPSGQHLRVDRRRTPERHAFVARQDSRCAGLADWSPTCSR